MYLHLSAFAKVVVAVLKVFKDSKEATIFWLSK